MLGGGSLEELAGPKEKLARDSMALASHAKRSDGLWTDLGVKKMG